MSKIKNFDRALYKSHYEAIRNFIGEEHLLGYDFNVCSKKGASNALAYLCVNNIEHTYHTTRAHGLCLITISWREGKEHGRYCFWCEGEV